MGAQITVRNMAYSEIELVEFAKRQDKTMGGYLAILLKFGVVGVEKEWNFSKLLNHLQTNREFNLITGFDYNKAKGLIWLDRLPLSLQKQFRSRR